MTFSYVPNLIAPSAWVLDRRRPGQQGHRALPPWGHKVSGLLCTSYAAQYLTLDRQVNGLDMLRKAGIQVILDHHALPGAQAVNQMFAGKYVLLCDTSSPERESDATCQVVRALPSFT